MAEQTDSTDGGILSHIHELIQSEHRLRAEGTPDNQELAAIEQALDQCWDLLRQRRARQEFRQDPDDAQLRPVSEVEGYRQ